MCLFLGRSGKYLSNLVDQTLSLKVAEEHAVRPCMAAQRRIEDVVKDHGLSKTMISFIS